MLVGNVKVKVLVPVRIISVAVQSLLLVEKRKMMFIASLVASGEVAALKLTVMGAQSEGAAGSKVTDGISELWPPSCSTKTC